MRVVIWALCALLFAGAARSAPPAPPSVSLPDAGTYSLWVQAKRGAVSVLPMTVTHKKTVALPSAHAGDTVYVLDAHTGNVAVRPLAVGSPLTLTVSDFRPLASPMPSVIPAPTAVLPPASEKPKGGGVGQFVSWLLGLALAACVVWFLIKLVQTRGEPLVALARKVGIDVPDPKALDPNGSVMPVYQSPKPRTVEAIPEDAGVPVNGPLTPNNGGTGNAPAASSSAPPLLGAGGASFTAGGASVPQLVGLQGLAAGSTFALTDGEVSVGRDGSNGIVLAEDSVSRRHARLTRDGQGTVHLADTGSANGVFVNGRRVQEAVLAHGDEIQIGDNSFRFEAPGM